MKKIGLFLALVMLVSLFNGMVAFADDVVEINFWYPQDSTLSYEEFFGPQVEKFNELNAGKYHATITLIPRGNSYEYENKLSAAFAAGTAPDILGIDGPNVAAYADSGMIVPITPYFSEEELADFYPSIIAQGTYDGELYTLAATESGVGVFYNKDMLEAAGINPPTDINERWTWQDLYDACVKVNETLTEENTYTIKLYWDIGEGMIYALGPLGWGTGVSFISEDTTTADGYINSPEVVEAYTFLQKFVAEGLASPQPALNDFQEGLCAFNIGHMSDTAKNARYSDLNWGVTFYPSNTKSGDLYAPCGDWCYGVSCDCKNVEAAAELVRFLTSYDYINDMVHINDRPAGRISVMEQFDRFKEYPLSIFDQQLAYNVPRPVTTSYPVLSTEFSAAIQDIILGSDVKASLDIVAQRYNDDYQMNNP